MKGTIIDFSDQFSFHIAKFNIAAKQTHEIYGINNQDATLENRANLKIVIMIVTIIRQITTNEKVNE